MKIYRVGGAVRDTILGLDPKDIDYVVVGGTEEEMLASGYQKVGADFPVFLHPETGEEYALARRERKNGTGYLGFEVDAGTDVTLEEDLSRRDLTINAMAMEVGSHLLKDPHGGLEDLYNKVLRHVSPAFVEDPLRVVRLARFYARYSDFTVAPETMQVAQEVVDSFELNALPFERFWAELEKVFTEKEPGRFFKLALELGFDQKVKFFSEVFATDGAWQAKTDYIVEMANLIAEQLAPELRVATFVAIMGTKKALKAAASKEIRDLHRNVREARSIQKVLSGESVFALIKQAGGFQVTNPQIVPLSAAIMMMNILGENIGIQPVQLLVAFNEAIKVNAEMFPHLKAGRELGTAIDAERKQRLIQQLNLKE